MKSIFITESDNEYKISISCTLLSKEIAKDTNVIASAIENSVLYIGKYIEDNEFLNIKKINCAFNDISNSYTINLIHQNKLNYKDAFLNLFQTLLTSELLGEYLTKDTYTGIFDKFFLPLKLDKNLSGKNEVKNKIKL